MKTFEIGILVTRRRWLGWLGTGAAAYVVLGSRVSAASQNPPPKRPTGNEPASNDEDGPKPPLASPKVILEANNKDIKKNVERLFQLASELKDEVDKTDSAQVMSLAMIKKAEEIEKLAKEIKSRAKG
jgi:hypothetical protein